MKLFGMVIYKAGIEITGAKPHSRSCFTYLRHFRSVKFEIKTA